VLLLLFCIISDEFYIAVYRPTNVVFSRADCPSDSPTDGTTDSPSISAVRC